MATDQFSNVESSEPMLSSGARCIKGGKKRQSQREIRLTLADQTDSCVVGSQMISPTSSPKLESINSAQFTCG